MTITANFGIKQFRITFNSDGGSAVPSKIADFNTCIAEPTNPTKKSLIFYKWYSDTGCIKEWIFSGGSGACSKVVSDTTLYAKWVVMDRDGTIYDTVRIGNQTWLAQNLRTTRYRDGISIQFISDSASWAGITTEAYCWPDDNIDSGKVYGALYNWYACVYPSSIAPEGWHLPSLEEWHTLRVYLITHGHNWDGTIGDITIPTDDKAARSLAAKSMWKQSPINGTPGYQLSTNNSTGFSALPVGRRWSNFDLKGFEGNFWTASEYGWPSGISSWYYSISYDEESIYWGFSSEGYGMSVRLVKDE